MRTNLTGHPAVVVPNGVTLEGKSSSITFTGQLYGEAKALAVAKAYQDATDFHLSVIPTCRQSNLTSMTFVDTQIFACVFCC